MFRPGKRLSVRSFTLPTLAVGAWMLSSCAPGGLANQALISSVRILASSSDKPYAKPGDTVNVETLTYDGRKTKSPPMTIFWLPFVCKDPDNDAYFACFQQIGGGGANGGGGDGGTSAGGGDGGSSAGGGDGGSSAGGGDGGSSAGGGFGPLMPGVDLTPFLPQGSSFRFTMPDDAITAHPTVKGVDVPYGLAIIFNVACAGHLEIVPLDPNNPNPQQVPIGCFDAKHNQLGPDDWVLGFTRVYAYADVTNANPVIAKIDTSAPCTASDGGTASCTIDGGPISYTTSTLAVEHCAGNCKDIPIGPVVPPSSQETQKQLGSGNQTKEEIWAEFYSTFGSFKNSARLLYDSTMGSPGGPDVTDNRFTPPDDAGTGFIWIVVHDNRGGASWVTIPVEAK
jgi:hypothetical protein